MNDIQRLRHFILFFFCLHSLSTPAQNVQSVYMPNIRTAQFYMMGDQFSMPVYNLNTGGRLSLEFDDLDVNTKSYYYTYVLCDYNWQPVDLSPFDYIKGFTQNRITNYRYSSVALTRYVHYSASLPDRNSSPTRSGNYLLKVFLDGDTSKLAFTKQLLVLDAKASISAAVVQPFTPDKFSTHQKIKFTASIQGLNSFSAAQQTRVVVLQNNRWDNAQRDIVPTFVRGNTLDYSAENIAVFPGGKEWRWLDLRSFRLQSDRVENGIYGKTNTDLYLKTDMDRNGQRYIYFADLDGMYNIVTYESINPFWQGDYATVHFYFARPDGSEYPGKDIYVAGMFTGYKLDEKYKMHYNDETMKYECSALMKQGYYNYTYIAVDRSDPKNKVELEGNYWETENTYTVLLYYKSFTDRSDQLIGITTLNSRNDRPGFSF